MNKVTVFISTLMSAVSNCRLYAIDHESVNGLIEKAFIILAEIIHTSGKVKMMLIDSDLVVNDQPQREMSIQEKNLVKLLRKRGISHITFVRGTSRPELKQLVAYLAASKQDVNSLPHITVGVVDVCLSEFKPGKNQDAAKSLSHFTAEQIQQARMEYDRLSPFKRLRITGFEEIVMHFVLSLKKEFDILKILEPRKSYVGYDYTHASNVSVLTILQAQTLGIAEDLQRDIGLAALFHDVGKLVIPPELLQKQNTPEARNQIIMELHPLYGAQYLAQIDGLTPLASIAAFEHHLKYDGQGYPKLRLNGLKQHLCSQMIAIADSFDNLRKTGPSTKVSDVKGALITMKTSDPGLFNPFLVDNFIRSIHLSLSH